MYRGQRPIAVVPWNNVQHMPGDCLCTCDKIVQVSCVPKANSYAFHVIANTLNKLATSRQRNIISVHRSDAGYHPLLGRGVK